jgi:hypothetical protein
MTVQVRKRNDPSDWETTYSCSPREAVIAAHAQSLRDWNTWDYETRYGHLVVEGVARVSCGAFYAAKVAA